MIEVTIVPDRELREGHVRYFTEDRTPEWYLEEAERWMNRYQEERARVGH